MGRFEEGDRVRIDIPDETDPDFEQFHGREGRVTAILRDDAARLTGDERDGKLYQIELADGDCFHGRLKDLRPPIGESDQ